MENEVDELKKQVERLREENLLLKENGPIGLYYELNRIVNATVAYTRKQSIESLINSDEKGDKKFERTMILIKNAKEHVLDMEEIKTKLRLTGNEEKDKKNVPFIESVATKRD
jgi:hypothetical protein